MMHFADLEVIPSLKNLHASGSLRDTGDRVVVSFGPEHAALEQRQVELALQEADKAAPSAQVGCLLRLHLRPRSRKGH